MSDASQKHTDEQRGLADARASLHRYAPVPWLTEGENLDAAGITVYKKPDGPHPDDWEGWLERRKQIEREEKLAFNRKYNYAP